MTDPGTWPLGWRLALAAAVMIAPSLLFLGLVRGLERLRDDAFVDRWLAEQGHEIEDDVLAVLGRGLDPGGSSSGPRGGGGTSSVRCPACGASNAVDARVCHGCLGRLPS